MKRPQFGIRLMLLVVALLATIFGWRAALEQQRREDRNGQRVGLQLLLAQFEKEQAKCEAAMQDSDPFRRLSAAANLKHSKDDIAELKKRIDRGCQLPSNGSAIRLRVN